MKRKRFFNEHGVARASTLARVCTHGPRASVFARATQIITAAMLIAAPGCVTETPQQRSRPQTEVTIGGQPQRPQAQSPANAQTTSDLGAAGPTIFRDFSATDPCAAQLQDISEALLLYYAVKKHLPQSLEEIAPYASAGTQLQLKCPVSGQPYIYNRNGPLLSNSLYLTDNTGRSVSVANQMSLGHMVIYDASPAHNGERWAIVFGMDTRGTTPVASPFRIPEKAFQDAVRASPMR